MKYTELIFNNYHKFYEYEKDGMNGYTKNRLHTTLGSHHMYCDTDKLEAGKKKFKKDLLKYYNNIITTVEAI